MKVTLAYVSSLNGKITQGDNPDVGAWSSPEDADHFASLRKEADVIIMDRTTYELVQPTPEADRLRLVYTSTPDRFEDQSVDGQLEFTNTAPVELIGRLATEGHQNVLLAGGPRLTGSFLEAEVIDDIYLTLEPRLFGEGRPMLSGTSANASLQLAEPVRQLNDRGTLLAHYTIVQTNET